MTLIKNKSLGPKESGQKYRDGFSNFINNTMTKEKLIEDNSKLSNLPTHIYSGHQDFSKKVVDFIPTKRTVEEKKIDPNET